MSNVAKNPVKNKFKHIFQISYEFSVKKLNNKIICSLKNLLNTFSSDKIVLEQLEKKKSEL